MNSYEYDIGTKQRAGSRHIAIVSGEIQKAFISEKVEKKITQQALADRLGVNRSVVNRQIMGLENLTLRSVGELLWALGWEPYFEARRPEPRFGNNWPDEPAIDQPSTGTGSKVLVAA